MSYGSYGGNLGCHRGAKRRGSGSKTRADAPTTEKQKARRREPSTLPSLSNTLGISTSAVGALNEMRVVVDLMLKGYHVFRALSSACPCDLVIMLNGNISKVEVKTAYKRGDSLYAQKPTKRQLESGIDYLVQVTTDEIIYQPPLGIGDAA